MANRDIVVIGGSAGSIGPLKTILAELPADFAAAVIVVIHVPAHSTGVFVTVASAATGLPVKNASDGDAVLPGNIYLAPPDRHLLVIDGILRLGHGPRENLVRPAIDPLFRSVALQYGPRCIGIILSGMLNDGASGLATIKEAGGIALVQTPKDAEYTDMPLSALEATPVDLSASALEIAGAIKRFMAEKPHKARQLPPSVRLEVDIAAGRRADTAKTVQIADPVALTCPDCGGVLSEVRDSTPLRFRCQVGHAFTDKTLFTQQEDAVDEAMRVALRIIEERAVLVDRMAKDAINAHRSSMAEMHEQRAIEYRRHADLLRHVIIRGMDDYSAKIGQEQSQDDAADQVPERKTG
jgi:two-component system, chemotaxis family, protein-glutamate methylesterase/glutaminase